MKITDMKRYFLTVVFIAATVTAHGGLETAGGGYAPAGEAASFFSDARTQNRVDSLLALMTLDEKIGQMVLYTSHFTVTGPTLAKNVEQAIRNGTCGNIFNAHVPEYNRNLQRIAVEETRMGIPLLFGYDVVHGMETIFPINLGMSCSWDMEGIANSARVAAREVIASGVNWTFSPMVDITRDPRWGRVSEGSGEDPYLGSLIAAAMVRGYQGDDLSADSTILACVKHFAAYGAAQAGRDYHTVDISERTLREVYLPPYKAAVDAGVGTVMTSFNDIDGVPATASDFLFEQILRREWGFNGFVVTDYTALSELIPHGVAADSLHAAELAVYAGINMDMEGDIYHKHLRTLVDHGRITLEQIDRLCGEVLKIKFGMGLFDDPFRYLDTEAHKAEFYKPANIAAARDMARKSFVLLENGKGTLPLEDGKKIALIGPFADSCRDMLGSWSGQGKADKVSSILDGFRRRFGSGNVVYAAGCPPSGDDSSGFAEAVAAAQEADVAVITVGLPGQWSGEATSLTSITIPRIQQELVRAVRETGKEVVLLIVTGRPLDLSWEAENSDAMMVVWYPGTEAGAAVADVVSGDFAPVGKLTMTFPRSLGQLPIHYDMKNTGRPYTPSQGEQHYVSRYFDTPTNRPLYPFGYGLSYTTFGYSDMEVLTPSVGMGTPVRVAATVTNTGDRPGEETVQLYVRDDVASVTRPVRMLKGFAKHKLAPGQSARVEFIIAPGDLEFYRRDMSWGNEPGGFTVWIGGDSDAELSGKFEIR